MRTFADETGRGWVATAREEQTPRHHGRWYLVVHPESEPGHLRPMAEVRWQTRASAHRTLATMSPFELRRRLHILLEREGVEPVGPPHGGGSPSAPPARMHAGAG